jgi:hypothetical protein
MRTASIFDIAMLDSWASRAAFDGSSLHRVTKAKAPRRKLWEFPASEEGAPNDDRIQPQDQPIPFPSHRRNSDVVLSLRDRLICEPGL